MASSSLDNWNDFETLKQGIRHNTVDRLKQIVIGLNDECSTHISKTGKKQDIIDRISSVLDGWRLSNVEDKWNKAKAVIYQVKNSGLYTPSRTTVHSVSASYPGTSIKPPQNYSASGSSSSVRFDHYSPRKPALNPPPITASSSSKANAPRFKESPFFMVEQHIIAPVECPESTSATDRRQQFVNFNLSPEQSAKLRSTHPKYQLRLFCTSSNFWSPNPVFRPNTSPCLIEFPPTCEVRVNSVQLTANLKGLKKKPGTAPPPDITPHVRFTPAQNRIEMVYVNSQQPIPSKKFYLIVMLVEATSVATLVSKLKESSYKSKAEIQLQMKSSVSQDEDIVAGPQKMSLKCPLSFARVQTPCRSSKCVHPQCFDATSWFSMMEQTTTWLCPVCERMLDCNDLIIDGYFDDILHQTPDSVEDVMVEADGEWHTLDNKHGSRDWLSSHPPSSNPPAPRKPPSITKPAPPQRNEAEVAEKAKRLNQEIVILDSDDEEEGRVKRELSPSFASGSSTSLENVPKSGSQSQAEEVIDLTLDSDDEAPPIPPVPSPRLSKQNGKRRADDAGFNMPSSQDNVWKKARTGDQHANLSPTMNGSSEYPPVSHHVMVLPPPAPATRFPNSYAPPPPTYNSGGYNGRSNQLAPIQYPSSRSRW